MKTLNQILMLIIAGLILSACSGQEARNEAKEQEKEKKEMADKAEKKKQDRDAGMYETAEFWVRGNCGMCEDRITDALKNLEGVKKASWDVESKKATVSYHPDKHVEADLHNAVAAVGHRTNEVDADEEAYSDLPPCCLDPEDPNYIEM